MKNVFYLILKAYFGLKIFKLVLTFWSYRKNGLIRNIRLIYDVIPWSTKNYNTHIAQYLTTDSQFGQVIK